MLSFYFVVIYVSVCVCVSMCVQVHMSTGTCRGQKGILDPLGLQLHEVVGHQT